MVTGDKGLAGAFNTNINKAVLKFLESKTGKNVDIICIGRKGRDFLRRRYPAARPGEERAGAVQIIDERINVLGHLKFEDMR